MLNSVASKVSTTALLGGVALVVSNLSMIPAIWGRLKHEDYASAVVFFGAMVVSAAYHSCREDFFCVARYERLKLADYLYVYRALIWTYTRLLAYGASSNAKTAHTILFFSFTELAYFVVLVHPDGMMLPLVGAVLPIVTLLISSAILHQRAASRLMRRGARSWTVLTVLLALIGSTLMFAVPMKFYDVAHTLWHCFSMLSAYTFHRAMQAAAVTSSRQRV